MARIILLILLSGMPWGQAGSERVHASGGFDLVDLEAVDLDGPLYGFVVIHDDERPVLPEYTTFEGSDFLYMVVGKRLYFGPQHKAVFSEGAVNPAGLAGCSAAKYVKDNLRIDTIPVGASICLRTSEGRYAEIKIEGFKPKEKRLKISYTTWEKENEGPAKK